MYRTITKPFFDFVVALLCLPFLAITIFIVIILIKIDDNGPIFYISPRVGKNGKIFQMIKFRTMKVNAEDIRLEDGSTFSSETDNRVTRLGKKLRKTSIDELPQIINILKFEMSFIGPRPDPVDWLERYPEKYIEFLKCRPGISGYNQAYFRNSNDGLQKMKNDFYYYNNISFFIDLKIILKTINTVFKRDNIYKK
jgi:lipopolysaccharide/colanic/teichoic acid biosynthesis glycosyltransferase